MLTNIQNFQTIIQEKQMDPNHIEIKFAEWHCIIYVRQVKLCENDKVISISAKPFQRRRSYFYRSPIFGRRLHINTSMHMFIAYNVNKMN